MNGHIIYPTICTIYLKKILEVIILTLLEKSLKLLIIPDKIPIAYYEGKVLDSEYRFKAI